MDEGPVVCDTGPLIALSLLGRLELLPGLYERVIAPRTVMEEATAEGLLRPGAEEISKASWLEVFDRVEPEPLLASELGAGEAAVIETAHQAQGWSVLLDDRRARRVAARAYGLRVRGTAGLLVAAKRSALVPEVRPLLEILVRHGYFLSRRLIERATAEAGEEP